ncbi:surface lipoprotein-related protein [Staphylococcus gallinarum]|uniref:Surface lipoprotein-related protein n=1 Tax=Staphylococcus gallinarum TaxID=1293 RepID=A0A380FIA2_STAGA|nr:surface lipoprotein-related protein [Staphylococcus gallinarum]
MTHSMLLIISKQNYKENAVKKAKDYADSQDMSNDAIYDQLTSSYGEKFTEEEAQYAIDHLNK